MPVDIPFSPILIDASEEIAMVMWVEYTRNHREDTMFDVEDWLYREIRELVGSGASARQMCLDLGDQLARLGETFGFTIESDPWISSRFEEAEVPIKWNDGRRHFAQVC